MGGPNETGSVVDSAKKHPPSQGPTESVKAEGTPGPAVWKIVVSPVLWFRLLFTIDTQWVPGYLTGLIAL